MAALLQDRNGLEQVWLLRVQDAPNCYDLAAAQHHRMITIVNHAAVDRGTLAAIYRQALRFIPESDLKAHFYSD